MAEAQLLGTLYQFPGVGRGRHRNTKIHYAFQFTIDLVTESLGQGKDFKGLDGVVSLPGCSIQ